MTYKQILALIKENSKIVAANSKAIEANNKAIKRLTKSSEANKKAIEQLVKSSEANKKAIEQLAESSKASQAHWDRFMERYGGYVDNESRGTEIFFIEGLRQQNLVVGDIKFDDIVPNSQRSDEDKVVAIELDGLLINGTTVGMLEVKSTLHFKDVERVRDKRVDRFRKFYTEHSDKKLAVILAGKLINPDAAELARELGYILLKPNNQGISIDASCYRAA